MGMMRRVEGWEGEEGERRRLRGGERWLRSKRSEEVVGGAKEGVGDLGSRRFGGRRVRERKEGESVRGGEDNTDLFIIILLM